MVKWATKLYQAKITASNTIKFATFNPAGNIARLIRLGLDLTLANGESLMPVVLQAQEHKNPLNGYFVVNTVC